MLVDQPASTGVSNTCPEIRAALYARTSTKEQHPESQLVQLRAVAAQRAWTITNEYVDCGVSGSLDRRPELDRLMRDVMRGGVNAPNVVAVFRFDRFARSVAHLMTALGEFRIRGVDFVSIHDCIDTTSPSGRFAFTLVGAMAELETDVIRARVKSGLQNAVRRGVKLGRPRVEVDLGRARHLMAEGASLRSAANTLGIGASTLSRALRHEVSR